MRKFLYVMLGLLLVAGAIGSFGYRQFGDAGRLRMERYGERSAAREFSAPDAVTRRAERPGGHADRQVGGLRLFELLIDVLNVVVGVVGITLAVIGMRMQRAAAAMQSMGTHRRSDA